MIEFLPLDTFFLLFEYFYIPIWGLFAALSIVFFVFLYIRNIEKYNISKEHAIHSMIHFAFWSLIGVLVAHRVLFLSNYSILNIGGRDSAGIFIGLIALLIYLIYNKVDFKNFFDMMIIPMIGLGAVMRIGCFLVACETGRQSAVPWSMFYQEAFRHNMGLYYLIINFA
ncbi:MAG: prolipoprotein diacylglyceryl transferase family protein, partial [Candidatus Woesearchaeota archaeon]